MKQSEKILSIVTAIAAVIFIYFTFFSGDAATTAGAAESGNLGEEKARFEQYSKTLQNGDRIQQEYERLTLRNVPESRGNESPGTTFSNVLSNILMTEFNQPSPRIEPYKLSVIPKVEDYYFIDISVSLDGKVDDMIRLLKQMEKRGLLIKEFTLEVRGPGWRGDSTLNVKVSRLVQHDKFSRLQLRARRGTTR